MSRSRRIQNRIPFDLANMDGSQDMGIRDLGIVILPVVLTRAEMGRVFGKSVGWVDVYLAHEGKELGKAMRVVNGRKMWLTKTVLDYIDGLVA